MQDLIINTLLKTLRITKKSISLLPFIALSLASCPSFADDPSSTPIPVVVISQIVQHVSLDEEREGIKEALAEAGYIDGKTIRIIYQNAQGNLATSNLIANQFAGMKPKPSVAVASSTPSTQTLMKPMREQDIPLVFTAVTDPLEAGIVTTLEARPEGITGVSDALGAGPQLDLIQKLKPSTKRIGIVYNSGEANSVKAVEELKAEAAKRGLTLILATADKSSDVTPATTSLVGKVDVIYIPNDNTAVASMENIVTLGKKYKLPVFAGDAGSVEKGAVAAQAYDRRLLGQEAGELVVKILKGEKAGDLPVRTNHPLVLMINLKSADDMGLTIPEDIKSQAKLIGGKS